MTINLMKQYVELTQKQIQFYLKKVLGNKYKKAYCDRFIEKYINIRYYNFYKNDSNHAIRKNVMEALKNLQEDMIITNIEDRDIIEKTNLFFYYVLYFDNVVYYKDLQKVAEKLAKLRKKYLNKEEENWAETFACEIKQWIEKKNDFLASFESEDFYIKIKNYPEELNVYRVNLKHNVKFPMEYSEFAINKVFQTGLIEEDKLVIEYYQTGIQVIKDILRQNFKREYVVEFSDSILKKSNKLKNLLNIIDNSAMQEKIALKIKYEHFTKNKEKIYELLRNGYKIAVVIDNSFQVNFKNIEDLAMFRFVIVSKKQKQYEAICEQKSKSVNVIEI